MGDFSAEVYYKYFVEWIVVWFTNVPLLASTQKTWVSYLGWGYGVFNRRKSKIAHKEI